MATTDARPVPKKNVAYRLYFEIRKSDGTLSTTWAGQDTELSLDGGNYADATNEATEIQTSGTGYIDLTADEMNADCVIVKCTVTNSGALPFVAVLFPTEAADIPVDASASAVASVSAGVSLADDAITAAKFDETTAFPLKSADTGATAVARTGADSDTLETLSDQIDGVIPYAGTGARTVVVTVTDGTDPLESANVRFTKGVTVLALQTDASGEATFYCDDGTWTLAVSLAGYTYTATTHVVDGAEAITAAMTAVAIAGATDPTQSNAYLTTYDAHGAVEASVVITFELVAPPAGDGTAHTRTAFTATSNGSGALTVALMRGAVYRARRGAAEWVQFTVGSAATYQLPQVLGIAP